MKTEEQQLEITMVGVEPCNARSINMVSMAPIERRESQHIGFVINTRIPIGRGITMWDVNEMVVVSDVYVVT